MRLQLIDRITALVPGQRIEAVKNLAMSEEYLADHFPSFPVMPGVLMLEALTQASAWLVRVSEDFAHSMLLLKEVRNIKYAGFVEPGASLRITCEVVKHEERTTTLKAQGTVDDRLAVTGRLTIERYNLAEADPHRADQDRLLINEFRRQLAVLDRTSTAASI